MTCNDVFLFLYNVVFFLLKKNNKNTHVIRRFYLRARLVKNNKYFLISKFLNFKFSSKSSFFFNALKDFKFRDFRSSD